MVAIFLFSILRQMRLHTTGAEIHKEHFGENRILISLFVNEISVIHENLAVILFFYQREFQLGQTIYQVDSMCEVSEL